MKSAVPRLVWRRAFKSGNFQAGLCNLREFVTVCGWMIAAVAKKRRSTTLVTTKPISERNVPKKGLAIPTAKRNAYAWRDKLSRYLVTIGVGLKFGAV